MTFAKAIGVGSDPTSVALESLDLGPIKFKLMHREDGDGWTRARADRVEILYRRFLTLIAKHPDRTIVPTKEIDEFWHAHILDTEKYARDTMTVFGFFLHHFPYFGMRGEADRMAMNKAFQETLKCYRSEFGSAWPDYFANEHECGEFCGGGNCGGDSIARLPAISGVPQTGVDFSLRPRV